MAGLIVGCENEKVVVQPPVESEEGKVESEKARVELEKKEENERLRVKIQEKMQNLDQYTKEGLEKDTKMDPFVKDALLMAIQQKQARKQQREQQREQQRKELMKLEKEAGKFLKVIDEEKMRVAEAEAELEKIGQAQREREELERKERNAEGVAPEGMVWIPGGKYLRGSKDMAVGHRQQYGEEFPAHLVEVDGFYIDATEVTNAEFAEFVKATGYKTLAEVGLSPKDFPQARPQDLLGGANVFKKTDGKVDPWVGSAWRWWSFTPGATWRTPEGPGSSIEDKMDHPVICINYDDAMAYAKWAGKRLPTEAEWERAARAGRSGHTFSWGDGNELKVDGKWMANVYQGEFPSSLENEDGFLLTAPVKSYPPNDWGVYDMAGNVWEICNDYYHPGYYHEFVKNPHKNPQGPKSPISDMERSAFNPVAGTCPAPRGEMNRLIHLRVTKGGSFLCSVQYCQRYRPAARHHHEVMSPTQHTGFRCVKDVKSK